MSEPKEPNPPRFGFERDLQSQLEALVGVYEQDRSEYVERLGEAPEWSPVVQLLRDADAIARLIRERAKRLTDTGELSERNQIHETLKDAMARLEEEVSKNRAELSAVIASQIEQAREQLPAAEAAAKVNELERCERDILGLLYPPSPGRPRVGDLLPPDETIDSPIRLVWEAMCVEDAWDVVSGIERRVRRQFELERLVDELVSVPHHAESCGAFLSLVSRCFVYGFDAECVAMCRGAMEQAFQEKVTYEHCELAGRRWDPKRKSDSHLADRIWAAFVPVNGLLVGRTDVHAAADRVKLRGDAAVHKGPGVTSDILGTIRDTLVVIDALASLPDP